MIGSGWDISEGRDISCGKDWFGSWYRLQLRRFDRQQKVFFGLSLTQLTHKSPAFYPQVGG